MTRWLISHAPLRHLRLRQCTKNRNGRNPCKNARGNHRIATPTRRNPTNKQSKLVSHYWVHICISNPSISGNVKTQTWATNPNSKYIPHIRVVLISQSLIQERNVTARAMLTCCMLDTPRGRHVLQTYWCISCCTSCQEARSSRKSGPYRGRTS